jgi:hypothetical protein
MCDNYKYYGNYDKNIKSIRGGGVITPSNPPNRTNTTDTIKNTWYNEIKPIPPLFKTVYYSDKNLTNGYLNEDNYVIEDKYISDYYYPSQKLNKVINLKKNKSKKIKKELNKNNPLKFPSPLINELIKSDNLSNKSDNLSNKSDNLSNKSDNLSNKSDNLSNKSDKSKDYIDYITNNTIYDGKYIYMLEDKPIKNSNNLNNKITNFPYLYKLNNNKIQQSDIEYTDKIESIYEDFYSNSNSKSNLLSKIPNTVLLIIFSVLLIIYFTIYQK